MTYHIVGLDLSLSGTGVARIRPGDPHPIHTTLVRSQPTAKGDYEAILERVRSLSTRVLAAATRDMEPDDVAVFAIEGPSFGSNDAHTHTRAWLWGRVFELASKRGLVAVVPPASLKRYMTGKGNADKLAMIAAVTHNFPDLAIVDDNEADGLGLALMVARELGSPMEPSVQRVTPAALDGVRWPAHITQRRMTT